MQTEHTYGHEIGLLFGTWVLLVAGKLRSSDVNDHFAVQKVALGHDGRRSRSKRGSSSSHCARTLAAEPRPRRAVYQVVDALVVGHKAPQPLAVGGK